MWNTTVSAGGSVAISGQTWGVLKRVRTQGDLLLHFKKSG